jgi:hypothetical protein
MARSIVEFSGGVKMFGLLVKHDFRENRRLVTFSGCHSGYGFSSPPSRVQIGVQWLSVTSLIFLLCWPWDRFCHIRCYHSRYIPQPLHRRWLSHPYHSGTSRSLLGRMF